MKYFFANWKMYLNESEAVALARVVAMAKIPKGVSLAIFPSVLHIHAVSEVLSKRIGLGTQDIGPMAYGAYTGDVSANEAKRMKIKYALVGHSERRKAGESNALIAKKFAAALQAGLMPVLCVGETEDERHSQRMLEAVLEQIESALCEASKLVADGKFLIAYEPVWAIGTGKTATPEQISEMHLVIRNELVALIGEAGRLVPILYGGSVDAEHMAELLALPSVNGVLVGGAGAKRAELKGLLKVVCS